MRHAYAGQVKRPNGTPILGILTKRQESILKYIVWHHIVKRHSPTIRDIADKFKIGTNGVAGHLLALKKKGWIERDRSRARSIVLSKSLVCEKCCGCGIAGYLVKWVNGGE